LQIIQIIVLSIHLTQKDGRNHLLDSRIFKKKSKNDLFFP